MAANLRISPIDTSIIIAYVIAIVSIDV